MNSNYKMNDTEKSILIGVGVAFVLGVVTFLLTSGSTKEKAQAAMNRQKAKYYINDTFHNKNAKKLVDKLSDDEVSKLVATTDKVKDLEDKFADMSDDLKDFMHDKSKSAKKAVKKIKK